MRTERHILVSVLIVSYRAHAELENCLDSLQRFLGGDLEVIVVNHASEPQAMAHLVRRFPWIQLIEVHDNPGFSAGVNRGAKVARGRYLLLLNPDCLVDSDVARTLAAWLEVHPDFGAAGAFVRYADGSLQPSARRFPDVTTALAGRTSWLTRVWPGNRWTARNLVVRELLSEAVEVDWVSGACLMVNRRAFESIGGMDEKFFLYWEDADLCFRLRRTGWRTVYNPSVRVTHLAGRSTALVRRKALIAFHRSAFRYFCKHGGRLALLLSPGVFLALQARLFLKLAMLRLREGPTAHNAPG